MLYKFRITGAFLRPVVSCSLCLPTEFIHMVGLSGGVQTILIVAVIDILSLNFSKDWGLLAMFICMIGLYSGS